MRPKERFKVDEPVGAKMFQHGVQEGLKNIKRSEMKRETVS